MEVHGSVNTRDFTLVRFNRANGSQEKSCFIIGLLKISGYNILFFFSAPRLTCFVLNRHNISLYLLQASNINQILFIAPTKVTVLRVINFSTIFEFTTLYIHNHH